MKIKNKKVFYIFLLQLSCVTAAVVVLIVIKMFWGDLFGEIKQKHERYFEDETVIEQAEESVPAAAHANDVTLVANSLTVPLEGEITSNFGYRNDPFTLDYVKHFGTDIAADKGTQIISAADGTVNFVGYDKNGYGNYLKISHNDTLMTLYGHCSEILVKVGENVAAGQPVATVGSTGKSTGNHLHFEIIVNGTPVNAVWYMEF